jgi:hypothetical protein
VTLHRMHEEKTGRAVLTREELGSAAALSVEVDKQPQSGRSPPNSVP